MLTATFPAGTLTGAPKVRAMELIDELEPVRRGVYGGAVGYLDAAGDLDMAIAIRTAVMRDGDAYVQAAAGVVADSVPALEEQETRNKARAVLQAIATAETLRPRRDHERRGEFVARAAAADVVGAAGAAAARDPRRGRRSRRRGRARSRDDVLPVTGRTVDGAPTALALVALAGVVAVIATRGVAAGWSVPGRARRAGAVWRVRRGDARRRAPPGP